LAIGHRAPVPWAEDRDGLHRRDMGPQLKEGIPGRRLGQSRRKSPRYPRGLDGVPCTMTGKDWRISA
jgi:hypothetical protein